MDADVTSDGDWPSSTQDDDHGRYRTAAERHAEDADLQASLADLSKLTSARLGLEESLTRVATYAVQAIPGADGAGLTLLEEGQADIIVTTDPFVSEVDSIQYSLRQGPCISAAAEARTILSGSLGADRRWSRFGGRVARLNVHSALSLPLITTDGVVGAMNIYAHAKHAFDTRAAELGEVFAVPAAVAVQNAHILARTQRLVSQLQSALDHRRTIDHAVGILMSRSGISEAEALDRLRVMSQHEHAKLGAVAEKVVREAVARARARHSGGQ